MRKKEEKLGQKLFQDILIFINEIKKKPLFQEDLTKLLYNKFNLKYIKLSGTHSKIKIKSTIEK